MDTKERNEMHLTGRRPRRKAVSSKPVKEPEVQIQYTPAKPFNRNRFLLHLTTVAAVVLALVLGLSLFFRAEQITVSGAEKYTSWEVREASGVQDGDGLLSLSRAKISARIRARLPYVETVRVGIKLPDTVNIEITERTVVYAIEDVSGAWWLLDAEGRIVDSTDAATAMDYTCIVGIKVQAGAVGEQAIPAEQDPTTEIIPANSVKACFDAAILVLAALEENGIMGKVNTVNVADSAALTLMYENRYEVSLGDTERLVYKISAMKAAIEKMGQYQNGYLDVSFTIWPNEVGYRPYDENGGKK